MEPTQPAEFSTTQTHWKNPTSKPVVVDIYVGTENVPPPARPYRRGERHQAHLRIRWAPGETKTLPSIYDHAIHDVRTGVIVGGLAPQLVRTDAPAMPLSDAIDVEKQKHREAVASANAALVAKKVAEETLVVATVQAAEAQKTIDAVQEMKADHEKVELDDVPPALDAEPTTELAPGHESDDLKTEVAPKKKSKG